MRFETAVEIDAEAHDIWRAWTDVEHWPQWTASVRRAQRLDPSADFGVGSRARLSQPGMRTMIWTVTECVPGRSFVWASETTGVRLIAGHILEPAPDARTIARLSFELTGPLAGLLGLLLGGRIRRYLQMEADGIRHHSEAGD